MDSIDILIRMARARLDTAKSGAMPAQGTQSVPSKPQPPAVAKLPSIQQVTDRKRIAFGQWQRLHASLRFIGEDEARFHAAKRMLELQREVQACWRVIDHFEKTKELTAVDPAPPEDPPFDPADYSHAELVTMRNSARAYISKSAKGGVPEAKVAQRTEMIEKIEKHLLI